MEDKGTAYMRFIKGKINKFNVLKSSSNASNTLSAINRMVYLKNNYCLYDNDGILYLTKTAKWLNNVKATYERFKSELDFNYITLFSSGRDRVDFFSIDEIVDAYFKQYAYKNSILLKLVNDEEINKIVKASQEIIRGQYKGLKLLSNDYTGFFTDEIKWMKSFGYTEAEKYQNCDRKGRRYKKGEGPSRLIKNSREREAIYKLLNIYEDKLTKNNYADYETRDKLALKEAEKNRLKEYTHIFLDECRSYTKTQLELVKFLSNNKSYGETTYIYDSKACLPSLAYLTKTGRISELNNGHKVKSFYFKKPFESSIMLITDTKEDVQERDDTLIIEAKKEKETNPFIENFEFISLKYRKEFKFIRDITRKDSIILVDEKETQEFEAKEMKEIPVFSEIAAGEPILMNPEMDDTFYLPEMWIRGRENHFILKVKGDSMIGAGIDDGDYVVIKSTQSAQNRDIVAVNIDGSATLKRLMIKRNSAVLMPENQKYKPIVIGDEGAQILGIAVGILKSA